MSANRLITDLGVKDIQTLERQGSSWIKATAPKANIDYKVEVTFGNMNGIINWTDERYRKDNVELRLLAHGFYTPPVGSKYADQIVFYDNAQYTTAGSNRTTFYINQFETNNADVLFTGYFRVLMNIPSIFKFLSWECGTYGSVRNRHWKLIPSS